MKIEDEILERIEKNRQIQVLTQEREMLIHRLQNYQIEAEARFKYIQSEIKRKEVEITTLQEDLQRKPDKVDVKEEQKEV